MIYVCIEHMGWPYIIKNCNTIEEAIKFCDEHNKVWNHIDGKQYDLIIIDEGKYLDANGNLLLAE